MISNTCFCLQFHGTFKRIILRSKAQRRTSKCKNTKRKKQEKAISIKLTDLQKKEQEIDHQNDFNADSVRSQTPQDWVIRGINTTSDVDVYAVVRDMMPYQKNKSESDDFQLNLSKSYPNF